jgi:hypothetical protein
MTSITSPSRGSLDLPRVSMDAAGASRLARLTFHASLLIAIGVTLLTFAGTFKYYGTFIRGADAQMYYAQARSAVVDADLRYNNEIIELTPARQVFVGEAGELRVPITPQGMLANKYTSGWALLTVVPFTLVHVACLTLGLDASGYSMPYDVVVAGWHMVLALAGLVLLGFTVARRAGHIPAAIAVLGIALATNFTYYAGVYPLMAHAASFAMAAALVCCAMRLFDRPTLRGTWLAASVAVLLLVLVRPTDVVLGAVLLPAAWKLWRLAKWRSLATLACAPFAVVAAVAIQLVSWRISHGMWMVNSYGSQGEGFHWFAPALPEILTAFNHGAWYFHPVLALGVAGLIVAASAKATRDRRSLWLAMLAAWLLHTYVHAAWHDWPFGHSFGHRVFLNSAPLMLVGIAMLGHALGHKARLALATGTAALVAWNLLLIITFIRGGIAPVGDVAPRQLISAQAQTVQLAVDRAR